MECHITAVTYSTFALHLNDYDLSFWLGYSVPVVHQGIEVGPCISKQNPLFRRKK